ncbi:Uncharacterised protein [Vibrio cholerae]|nr:Uncharacterised protein [Vibrio cholerae]CSI23125.1 Uncharacterised protein [Vibrio cholerae]
MLDQSVVVAQLLLEKAGSQQLHPELAAYLCF